MWWFRWHARRFFRSFMRPMAPTTAVRWDRNLRLLYIFCAFNALVLSLKWDSKRKAEGKLAVKDESAGHQAVRYASPGGDVHVINMGFGRPTERFTVNTEEYREEYEKRVKLAKEENRRIEEEKKGVNAVADSLATSLAAA